jgi:NitT/TauT family transport system permease protein
MQRANVSSSTPPPVSADQRLPGGRRFWAARLRARAFVPLLALLGALLIWEGIARLAIYPVFILPGPGLVIERLGQVLADGSLWPHVMTTVGQMMAGLAIGVPTGVMAGVLLGKNRTLEAALSPIILAAQSTPVVAYAPLLIIWFGSGSTSKVVITALIVFFPMLVNTMAGIHNVPPSRHELMRLFNATPWQTFWKLEFPASLPVLFAGLRVSVTLAVIGSVVGEFISASSGLGYLIKVARDRYDTPLVLVAVVALAVLARLAYWLVTLIERRVVRWRRA